MRVLLVGDDARIARFAAKGLREQAYAVEVATNGDDALYQAEMSRLRSFQNCLASVDTFCQKPEVFQGI